MIFFCVPRGCVIFFVPRGCVICFSPERRYKAGNKQCPPVNPPECGQWISNQPRQAGSREDDTSRQLGRGAGQQNGQLGQSSKGVNAGLSINIRGLYPMSNKTKVAHLSDLACESQAPFIALTETHLNSEIQSAEIQIQGYKLYRSDRMGGRSHGGCAVYCREDLTVKEKMKFSNNYCESQILEFKELNIVLINIYRPPNTPQQLFEETLNKCQESLEEETNQKRSILALGDYNFPFIKWPSRRIYSRDNDPSEMSSEKKQGKMLLDWTEMNFLEQYIHSPT